ncbi:hypothetical protein DFA_07340 [Cavenderia fasciculata]|uniref:Uncharacterized protein n=1 Tax=Cavenderia fasciculata TaxID=261658 RepID=F4PW55_CACFS|nr:uncharacterized protein DFA_07340 [Cavenderia fasciculata]EGG20219.1 hypothetical protein DFA_07340 [Cavenderia fasciculata]|eukprot:XP_004367202.1 hypothetical protein DFA_07340 [Cavenderia fasciculata]
MTAPGKARVALWLTTLFIVTLGSLGSIIYNKPLGLKGLGVADPIPGQVWYNGVIAVNAALFACIVFELLNRTWLMMVGATCVDQRRDSVFCFVYSMVKWWKLLMILSVIAAFILSLGTGLIFLIGKGNAKNPIDIPRLIATDAVAFIELFFSTFSYLQSRGLQKKQDEEEEALHASFGKERYNNERNLGMEDKCYFKYREISDIILFKIIGFVDDNVDIICLMMTCKAFYNDCRSMLETMYETKRQVLSLTQQPIVVFKRVESTPEWLSFKLNIRQAFGNIYNTSFLLEQRLKKEKKEQMEIKEFEVVNQKIDSFKQIVSSNVECLVVNNCEFTIDKNDFYPSLKDFIITCDVDQPIFPTIQSWPQTLTKLCIGTHSIYLQPDIQKSLPPSLTTLDISFDDEEPFQLAHLGHLTQLTCLNVASASFVPIPSDDFKIPPNLERLVLYFYLEVTTDQADYYPTSLTTMSTRSVFKDDQDQCQPILPSTLTSLYIGFCDCFLSLGYIPQTVIDLDITFSNGAIDKVIPTGVQTLRIINQTTRHLPPDCIPDSVTHLKYHSIYRSVPVAITHNMQQLSCPGYDRNQVLVPDIPSSLKSIDYTFPLTLVQPFPIFYLPTSLEELTLPLVNISDYHSNHPFDRLPIYSLPTNDIYIINNTQDINDQLYKKQDLVIPYNIKRLTCKLDTGHDPVESYCIRIDQIIYNTRITSLSIYDQNRYCQLDFQVRRLGNDDISIYNHTSNFILISNNTLFGGIFINNNHSEKLYLHYSFVFNQYKVFISESPLPFK